MDRQILNKTPFWILLVGFCFFLSSCFSIPKWGTPKLESDLRAYQHGIDIVEIDNGMYWAIWSSSGIPPTGTDKDGSWPHDIYASFFSKQSQILRPEVIISNPEAQEPASSAINSAGNIMITMEDGWNNQTQVTQRYGVYDRFLKPINPYPLEVYPGGHSAHVAACGEHFVIFTSEGWVNGGGVDELGSGDDVFAHIYSSTGDFLAKSETAVGDETRDWWPLIAGSENRAALLWQRFVDDREYADLFFSVIEVPSGKTIIKPFRIENQVEYYTYDVAYLKSLNAFLVTGTYEVGGGFAILFDVNGKELARSETVEAIVRESKAIIYSAGDTVQVAYPTAPTGLMVMEVTNGKIVLKDTFADDFAWEYIGTSGVYLDPHTVFILTLSHQGLVDKYFDVTPKLRGQLLSEGKPAFSSSNEDDTVTPEKAFDGNKDTRWGSLEKHDPEWIYVDLGQKVTLDFIKLSWDSIASEFEIQVSDDAKNWTKIFTGVDRPWEDEIVGLKGSGRYVRMYGTAREDHQYGYSLIEFQVYGFVEQ
jgi:hypothetical protein